MNTEIRCPFCERGTLWMGNYKVSIAFQCVDCKVMISFRESFEEIGDKLKRIKNFEPEKSQI